MKQRLARFVDAVHPRRLSALARFLLADEANSGKLILVAAAAAIIIANSPWREGYHQLWSIDFRLGLGGWNLVQSLRLWVNDGLMGLFFLVVGLELKRELVTGELRRWRTAALPIGAAIGGMIVPALLYLAVNTTAATARGWAIPTATDIAFAIGILALLGRRIPAQLRLFLLTLAIVDDILAVLVIAIFYNHGLQPVMLCYAGAIILAIYLLGRQRWLTLPIYIVAGLGLWLAIRGSGIHASITGAILGLLAPTVSLRHGRTPLAERLERYLIPVSTLLVVPLFAFANTGISLSLRDFQQPTALPITIGIVAGLVLGKVTGITAAAWLLLRTGVCRLPMAVSLRQILGVGCLAGIGFTVSIFVTELAFSAPADIAVAKVAIFAASALSASIGLIVLRRSSRV